MSNPCPGRLYRPADQPDPNAPFFAAAQRDVPLPRLEGVPMTWIYGRKLFGFDNVPEEQSERNLRLAWLVHENPHHRHWVLIECCRIAMLYAGTPVEARELLGRLVGKAIPDIRRDDALGLIFRRYLEKRAPFEDAESRAQLAADALRLIEKPVETLKLCATNDVLPDRSIAPKLHMTLCAWLGKEVMPLIPSFAESASEPQRQDAAKLLGMIAAPESLPMIARLAGDSSAEVRRLAYDALAEINDQESVRILRGAMESERDDACRQTIRRSLFILGEPDAEFQKQMGPADRPRIFINRRMLERIRAEAAGPRKQEFEAFLAETRRMMQAGELDKIEPPHHERHHHRRRNRKRDDSAHIREHLLAQIGFAYLVTGDAEFGRQAVRYLLKFIEADHRGTYRVGACAVYDWCHDLLTPEERRAFVTSHQRSLHADAFHAGRGRFAYLYEKWQGTNPYHTDTSRYFSSAVIWAMAVHGDGIADYEARKILLLFLERFPSNIIGGFDEAAGDGCYVGYQYNNVLFLIHTLLLLGAWRGEDAFGQSSFLRHYARHCLYRKDMPYPITGDYVTPFFHTLGMNPLRVLAAIYQDPIAEAAAGMYREQFGPDRPTIYDFLAPAASVKPLDPEKANLPLSVHFPIAGQAIMRSSWSDPNMVNAAFDNSPYLFYAHSNLLQNHFVVNRGQDPLVVRGGVYTGGHFRIEDGGFRSHYSNYFQRTVSGNTLLVHDPAERAWPYDNHGYDPLYTAGIHFVNDGGQIFGRIDPAKHPIGARHFGAGERGEITAFVDAGDYVYIRGDASAAYLPQKLRLFTREFVFLRPNRFVIFDRVISTRPELHKSICLHFMTQPKLDGTLRVVQGTASAGIAESSDSATVRVDVGQSSLICQTLLPVQRTIRAIGGTGYEFWVDGANRAPEPPFDDRPEWLLCAWRIEIEPAQPATEDFFLTVLTAGPSGMTAEPAELVRSGSTIGARIGGTLVSFSTDGSQPVAVR